MYLKFVDFILCQYELLGTLLDGEPIISLPPKVVELKKVDFTKEERDFYSRLENDSRDQFKVCFYCHNCASLFFLYYLYFFCVVHFFLEVFTTQVWYNLKRCGGSRHMHIALYNT